MMRSILILTAVAWLSGCGVSRKEFLQESRYTTNAMNYLNEKIGRRDGYIKQMDQRIGRLERTIIKLKSYIVEKFPMDLELFQKALSDTSDE
jgi:hypothetical protein